jgi:hypothetical protein
VSAAHGGARVTASLMVHLYPGVPVRVSLHPGEDRVVVAIGTSTLLLDLFVDRAELVALRDALTAAVLDLDTDTDTYTYTARRETTGEQGDTAGPDEVHSAA